MDGDTCRMCKREVHDLNGMSSAERRAFLKACSGEVCVSYKVAAGAMIAFGALAAGAVAAPAASAQTDPNEVFTVIVGGIKDPANTVLIEDEADEAIPELPVVFEPAAKPETAAKPTPQDDAKDIATSSR